MVYPEGTLTRDPDLWPMTGKSGAARIALETGCPVIPVGQWGAQELLRAVRPQAATCSRASRSRCRSATRSTSSDLVALPRTPEVVQQATDRIMDAVTALVAEIRGETPPAERFDPRKAGRATDRQPEQEGAPVSSPLSHARQGRGVQRRVVGHGVLARARRRRQRRHAVGAPRGGRAARSPRSARTPTTCRASSCRPRSARPTTSEEALAGADIVVLADAVADAAREPHRRGRRTSSEDAVHRLADEGRRARHASSG